ncbi:transcriptional regulator [Streptomyces sp. Ru73]|uniref:helix-turn-helix domain-containing protein n=1 Tax=Streptomyces sp. Ru73 TaxID=2080748 RepID=UPI000CDE23BF|nr:helix-turn-helix transcriptional regulator [Streptomyces sp. Ru73]POX43109.1 transcriptional regulator [Streptomyces sp. Ru73]
MTNGTGERPAIWAGYGKLLKLFRERAGLTQQQLAEAVGYSYELVASVEQGRRPAKNVFTEAVEDVLEAAGALRTLQPQVELAKFPEFFKDFALLEAEALSRFSYDPLLIPGLLQTEEYARNLLGVYYPPLDDETVEQSLAVRLRRQALLKREKPPLALVFILEEAALRRMVGTASTMKAQMAHLLTCGQLRNVAIQVMPTDLAAHAGLDGGTCVLLETSAHRQAVYLEAHSVGTMVFDADRVSQFSLRYGMLRTQALGPVESAHLIERVAGEI